MLKRIIAVLIAALCVFAAAVSAGAAETDDTDILSPDAEPAAAESSEIPGPDAELAENENSETPSRGAELAETSAKNYPEITIVSPTANGFTVSWSAYPGAYKYRLFIRKPDNSGWKKVGDTYSACYTHSNLSSGTSYRYTVRALDSSGGFMSDYDKAGVTKTFFSTPVLKGTENQNAGQKVSWNAVSGAENYRIYIKESSTWKILGYSAVPYFVNTGAESGNSYTYTVRCCTADGRQLLSYYNKNGVSGLFVAAPQITSFAPVENGTQVEWTAVNGAAKYRLFIKKSDDSGWKKIGDTAGTSLSHTGLEDGTVYKYTVRAMDAADSFVSGYNSAGWLREYIAPAELTEIRYAKGKYRLGWDRFDGADGYEILSKTFGGDWTSLGKLRGSGTNACTYFGAEPGGMISFAVVYLDAEGCALNCPANDSAYYVDGVPADGELEINGNTVHFENGHVRQGYVTIDGKTYYYDANGVMGRSDIVGSKEEGYTVADENGVCCVTEEIMLAAEYMMKYCKGDTLDEKMKSGFMYMAKNFPYKRTYDHPSKASDMPALAIDMFTNERGNCFRYAACFACVAKAAGYRSRVVIGDTVGNPHGWVEVLVDGKWLICDPDAQLPGYGMPDYKAYMMTKHYWSITPQTRCEIIIDENGIATWK